MESESQLDRVTKLKPIGELKVVNIPFIGTESTYAASVKPGNSVWGKSWRRPNKFDERLRVQSLLESPPSETVVIPGQSDVEREIPPPDKRAFKASQFLIGIGILITILFLSHKLTQ
jgi:hypothetical protein